MLNITIDSTVETLQVGFTESAVVISEDVGMVTLTIEINQNSWMFQPVTVAYITLEASGVTNAASKFALLKHFLPCIHKCVFLCSKQC